MLSVGCLFIGIEDIRKGNAEMEFVNVFARNKVFSSEVFDDFIDFFKKNKSFLKDKKRLLIVFPENIDFKNVDEREDILCFLRGLNRSLSGFRQVFVIGESFIKENEVQFSLEGVLDDFLKKIHGDYKKHVGEYFFNKFIKVKDFLHQIELLNEFLNENHLFLKKNNLNLSFKTSSLNILFEVIKLIEENSSKFCSSIESGCLDKLNTSLLALQGELKLEKEKYKALLIAKNAVHLQHAEEMKRFKEKDNIYKQTLSDNKKLAGEVKKLVLEKEVLIKSISLFSGKENVSPRVAEGSVKDKDFFLKNDLFYFLGNEFLKRRSVVNLIFHRRVINKIINEYVQSRNQILLDSVPGLTKRDLSSFNSYLSTRLGVSMIKNSYSLFSFFKLPYFLLKAAYDFRKNRG